MLRIAHISDLHIEDSQVRNENRFFFEWLQKIIGNDLFRTKIDVGGHNHEKLDALKNVFRLLKPNLILVTGDITNFGDEKSFRLAAQILKELKQIAEAEHVICVPGNHDTLIERVEFVKNKFLVNLNYLPVLGPISRYLIDVHDKIRREISNHLENVNELCFLNNYKNIIEPLFGKVDPGSPLIFKSLWGNIMIFSFNSTNDSILMANEGLIGAKQFNYFNSCFQDPDNKDLITQSLRIAILHHHPISAPGIRANMIERGFNWMQDGPRFIDYMNSCNFHFVLHGHEHKPFLCNVNYANRPGKGLYIVAAGSTLQGDDPDQGSFNVIDLRTPFEAKFSRYDYKSTGYSEETQRHTLLDSSSTVNNVK
jgi:3',5'-cyclic AMP phosphodiesterase CpdA